MNDEYFIRPENQLSIDSLLVFYLLYVSSLKPHSVFLPCNHILSRGSLPTFFG